MMACDSYTRVAQGHVHMMRMKWRDVAGAAAKDATHRRVDAVMPCATRAMSTTTTRCAISTSRASRRASSSMATTSRRRRHRRCRGVEEETNFAPIDGASEDAPGGVAEGRFGPECTLLVGFTREETAAWREVMDEIGADFVRVTTCVKSMLRAPLGRALETVQEDASAVAPALGVPRMMFLSGMNSMEVMEIVGVYEERGWAPSVFACAVPKNYETPLADLLTEIMDDHERLTGEGA